MKFARFFVLLLAGLMVSSVQAGDPERGQELSQPCAACHGTDGNSADPANPRIAGLGERYFIKQIEDYQTGRREDPIMEAQVAGLSEQDIRDLAAFYQEQTREFGYTDPELAEKGERLFRGGNLDSGVAACTGCHGPAGEGMESAGFPALAGQHAEYTEEQMRAFRAAGRDDLDADRYRTNDSDGDDPGIMQNIAKRMSDREIRAVSQFLQGLYE